MTTASVVSPKRVACRAKEPGRRVPLPQESWAALTLRHAWPGSPPKVPYLARPGTDAAHGLLNNYERTDAGVGGLELARVPAKAAAP